MQQGVEKRVQVTIAEALEAAQAPMRVQAFEARTIFDLFRDGDRETAGTHHSFVLDKAYREIVSSSYLQREWAHNRPTERLCAQPDEA